MDDEPNPYAAPEAPLDKPAVISTELVEPLVFRGCLGETDVVEMQRCQGRLLIGRPIRWLAVVVATVLAAGCLASILLIGPHVATVVVLFALVYLVVVFPFERTWHVRRHYRRHAAKYLETRVSLSESRVSIENEAIMSESRWDLVGVIADTPSGLLFCNTARQAMFWLPARLFEGNTLREQVLSLAKRKGVRVQRIA